jgi:PAS domain S-box-containing protein
MHTMENAPPVHPTGDSLKDLLEMMRRNPDPEILDRIAAGIDELTRQNRELEERINRADWAKRESDAVLSASGRWKIVYDAGGRVIRANRVANAMAGTSLQGMDLEAVARLFAMRYPDGRALQEEELPAYRALRGERVETYRLDVTDRSGRIFHAVASASPIRLDNHGSAGAVVVWQDITEQEQVQRRLIETNALLEGMFESLGDLVGIKLPDYTILRYNKAGYEMLGMKPDEAIGKKCYELLGHAAPCEVCATQLALQSKKQAMVEKYVPELGRHLECWSNPILDAHGEVVLVIEHLHDITGRVHAEEELRGSEATARALLNAPTDAVSLIDVNGRFADINETMAERLGRSRDEIIGKHIRELFPAEAAARREANLHAVIGSGTPARFEDRGERGWYDTVVYPIRNETGRVIRVAVIARDITERKRMEVELQQSEERFRSIFEESPIAIGYFDGAGRLVELNPASRRLFGIRSIKEVEEYNLFTDPNLPESACIDLEREKTVHYTAEFDLFKVETHHLHRTSRPGIRHLDVLVTRVGQGYGTLQSGYIALIQDITDRVETEKLKQRAYTQIEQNMEQFAILGDHIRQPLQVILGTSSLIDDPITEKIVQEVQRINDIIKKLDRGWIESREIREFLRRHEMAD